MKTTWQTALKQAAQDPTTLSAQLQLDSLASKGAVAGDALFKTKIPPHWLKRLLNDPKGLEPLLRQVLPVSAETATVPGYSTDPLQEANANPLPGVLHKYQSRALLILSTACAVHCRYCFRRHFPYSDNNPGTAGLQQALAYIAADPAINEVILSGGDPLVVNDAQLAKVIQALSAIPHLTTVRIHTRLPVVMPERITPELLAAFADTHLKRVMVIHANHPAELDPTVVQTLRTLKAAGFTLLNQAVLLKDVNDSAQTLVELSHALFAADVLPYYLHQLDTVAGAAHFAVPTERGLQLIDEIRAQLPGYLVPRFAQEIPNRPYKTLLS